jgi:hypothetical protein
MSNNWWAGEIASHGIRPESAQFPALIDDKANRFCAVHNDPAVSPESTITHRRSYPVSDRGTMTNGHRGEILAPSDRSDV